MLRGIRLKADTPLCALSTATTNHAIGLGSVERELGKPLAGHIRPLAHALLETFPENS